MYMRKLNKPYQTAVNGLEAFNAFKKDPLSLRLILMGSFIKCENMNIADEIS
jgi:hypothetical protein